MNFSILYDACNNFSKTGRTCSSVTLQAPSRTQEHCSLLLSWDRCNSSKRDKFWWKTIFLDKKKFNYDGPDGHKLYWQNLRNEKQMYSTRVGGGASVMLWGAFFYSTRNLVFLEGMKNFSKHCKILASGVLSFVFDVFGKS